MRAQLDARRIPALRHDLETHRSPAKWPTPAAGGSRSRSKATARVSRSSGKTIEFAGYLRAYVEGSDDPEAELADQERVLPQLDVGEGSTAANWKPKSHTTQPPARFSEASLTRRWKNWASAGPAPTLRSSTPFSPRLRLQEGERAGSHLDGVRGGAAAGKAFAEPGRLRLHGGDGRRSRRHQPRRSGVLGIPARFYYGKATGGLKPKVESKMEEIDNRELRRMLLGTPVGGPHAGSIFVCISKNGPYLVQENADAEPQGEPGRSDAARRANG